MGSQPRHAKRIRRTKIAVLTPTMKTFMSLLALAVLVALATCTPLPEGDMSNMEIYTKCRTRFGTTPKVECSSTTDCSLKQSKCPEHDCLPSRDGRSFCTWQSY